METHLGPFKVCTVSLESEIIAFHSAELSLLNSSHDEVHLKSLNTKYYGKYVWVMYGTVKVQDKS